MRVSVCDERGGEVGRGRGEKRMRVSVSGGRERRG